MCVGLIPIPSEYMVLLIYGRFQAQHKLTISFFLPVNADNFHVLHGHIYTFRILFLGFGRRFFNLNLNFEIFRRAEPYDDDI